MKRFLWILLLPVLSFADDVRDRIANPTSVIEDSMCIPALDGQTCLHVDEDVANLVIEVIGCNGVTVGLYDAITEQEDIAVIGTYGAPNALNVRVSPQANTGLDLTQMFFLDSVYNGEDCLTITVSDGGVTIMDFARYVNMTNVSVNVASIDTDTITADSIASGAIGAAEIDTNAIGAAEIATGAIDADAIEANAIGVSELAANAIGADEIATDAIGALELAANAIGASELATSAIGADEIAANAIGASELATDAIGGDELAATATTEIVAGMNDPTAAAIRTEIDSNSTQLVAIKAKTDDLTFTKALELDSNATSMNDVEILGTGTAGDPWNGE